MQVNPSVIKKSTILSAIVVVFLFTCGGSLNPRTWKTQVNRLTSPCMLIQPDKVAHFYQEMEEYVQTDPVKMFEFIEAEIQYTNDIFNHRAVNHLATAEEVLLSQKDDCDGQAVLLCSVLRYKGYDAYTLIGPSHAWVEVETDEETLSINSGRSWFVKFNESSAEWKIQPLLLFIIEEFLLLTVFFYLLIYSYEKGFFTPLQDVLGYFKYVFLLLLGGVVIVIILLTYWVPGLLAVSVAALVIMEVLARARRLS
ncbi:MAG: transglutaminase domain-containing protein [Theionarchaea archaeon]|nr:transglutaminase domain-containing protein [Theionarchaea archaeon]